MKSRANPFVMCVIVTSFCFSALSPLQAEQQLARGYVFHDRNANGTRDANEPGLPKIRVSNGRAVVQTDKAGRYELAVGGDTILFVIKPRGWMVPVDKNQLPRFYHIHKPGGSPHGLKYAGVEPTGPLPSSIDFPLVEHPEADRFKIVVFGDPQPNNLGDIYHLAHDIVDELVGTDASFGLTLGDDVWPNLYGRTRVARDGEAVTSAISNLECK